ncbi:MAG TPA: DUF4199 family protein [Pyrinomonadaceae bacterium]|jgi:hypothetical protein
MKIPLKYGLLITLGLAAWVLIAHSLVTNPQSIVHSLGIAFFTNVLQFAMLYLGLKALEREKGDRPTFKQGLKTGVAISFVYGLTASLFFAGLIAVMGTKWIATEPGELGAPMSRVILGRFLGLFISALLFGLIYSTVVSFFIAKRRSEEPA